jgi:pimeloyl-ACP methyl ester carboxylesterase
VIDRETMLVFLGGAPLLARYGATDGPEKELPITGETFCIQGSTAFQIWPEQMGATKARPWVWYAPTLPKYPGDEEKWMFEQFLAKGIAIAGIDVGESYGSPKGEAVFQSFYEALVTHRGMSPKPALLARSRGGLMLYNWAAEHAESVACIAGIYPVCNLASYPGLDRACGAYELSERELAAQLAQHNPIDRLAPLARAGVPIHHLHGDSDTVVPLEQNSAIVKHRYDALGGKMTLQIIEGGGHDVKDHWFCSQALVDFVIGCVVPDGGRR